MKCPLCQETIPLTVMESIQNNRLPALRLYAANSSGPLQRAFNNAHEILLKKNKVLLEKELSLKRKLEDVEKEHNTKVNYFFYLNYSFLKIYFEKICLHFFLGH